MALRAARGSEALLGIALDATSDTFNVGQPALTVAGDNYGFRFLRPDSFNLGATYETVEPSELTGAAFRGANTPGATNVAGTVVGSIRTGSAVPSCYSMFGSASKSELLASYAYQYIWTTASKSSPRSLTALTHKGGSLTPEIQAKFVATIPLGRPSTPLDIANACLYLASDDAEFITGVEFPVDGGRTI